MNDPPKSTWEEIAAARGTTVTPGSAAQAVSRFRAPVKGVNGQVSFDGTFVTIYRKGFVARGTVGKGEKRIPLASITAVQWKPAAMVNGFIQFTVPGGNEGRSTFGRQTTDATKDENSIVFNRSQMSTFAGLREAIESAIAARFESRDDHRSAPEPGTVSTADELTKLASLHAQGVLTAEEFSAAKARLLGL